jgi:serine/threonine protein kinase
MTPLIIAQRYQMRERLASGTKAQVYLADDCQTHQLVAVKTPARREEYRILKSIHHPQIPACYGYVCEAGTSFLMMEYVRGEPLADVLIRQEYLEWLDVHQILLQLFAILQMLAEQDPPIVYRDLHAGNLIRTPEGRLSLIDFGSAYRLDAACRDQISASSLLLFLDYGLLPYLTRGSIQRAVATWVEQWRTRFFHRHPPRLDAVRAAWHALVQPWLTEAADEEKMLV